MERRMMGVGRAAMLAAAMAAVAAAPMPTGYAPTFPSERAVLPEPPRLRDERDRKRKKKLKAALKKKRPGLLSRLRHRRTERIAAAHIRDGFDMRHEKYLHAHARRCRHQQWALIHPSESEPKEWTAKRA